MMRDDFGGEIPKTQEELMRFPGVGRKVANLIVSEMFGIPAVVVDTHCMRVSGRLGLSSGKDPAVIEKELMKILPEEEYGRSRTCRVHRKIPEVRGLRAVGILPVFR